MTEPRERALQLLLVCKNRPPMERLAGELRRHGLLVDLTDTLAELRSMFFQSGGHDLLVLAPDLAPSLAHAAAICLRSVDPELPIVAFGDSLSHRETPAAVTRLPAFHPTSRAGLGAVLRAVKTLC